jgi:hypothetical protein
MRRFCLALLGAVLLGQNCPENSIPAAVTVELRDRTVQEPLRDARPADLALRGKGITEKAFAIESGLPADLVVLIEDRGRGGLLAGAADLFVKALAPADRVAVLTYGVSVRKQLDFSNDKEAIRLAIEKGADGMHLQVARPFYGVAEALKLFGKPEPGRLRAILMLGDDRDSGSQIRVEQLAANLLEERVSLELAIDPAPGRKIPRVNVLPPTLGHATPAQRDPLVGVQPVSSLAAASGGSATKFERAEFFAAMRERLKDRLTLRYCVERKHASRIPRVELSPEGRRRYPDAIIVGGQIHAER